MQLILLIAIIPFLLGAGEVKTVSGKADSAIASVIGKAGTGIKTLGGKDYNDGDAGFSCSYDVCETFNGSTECASGYSSTCDNAWTVTKDAADTIDFDNSTSPAPLDGTYSLRMTSANTTGSNMKLGFADADNAYMFFIVNFDSKGTETQYRCIAGFVTDASADVCFFCLNNANPGQFVTYNGTGFSSGVAASADTTYYIWLEHVKSTSCAAYISASATKPGSATVSTTGKNSQAGTIHLQTKHSSDIVFGKIRQSATAIGSDPE